MKRKAFTCTALVWLSIFIWVGGEHLSHAAETAQTLQKQAEGVPIFQAEPSWAKVPGKWKLGDVTSVSVDAQDHVWILHRSRTLPANQADMAAPSVLEFDSAGNFLQAWGGPGDGYDWPQREHGIDVDYKGNVWIGGNNCPARKLPRLEPVADDQILKFTSTGKFVMQIGRSDKSTGDSDTKNLHLPADVFVYQKTNEVFVADGYANHRVIVFDADTGTFKRMWGAFGNKPQGADLCPSVAEPGRLTPEQILVRRDWAKGLMTLHPREYEGPGPQQFDVVHAIRVSNDGLVYVGDRDNRRVQVFTLEGKYVKQVVRRVPGAEEKSQELTQAEAEWGGGLAFSADPKQEFLYVAGSLDITVLNRKTLEILYSFPSKGGQDGGGHQIATDSKGNIYAARESHGIQKWVFEGFRQSGAIEDAQPN